MSTPTEPPSRSDETEATPPLAGDGSGAGRPRPGTPAWAIAVLTALATTIALVGGAVLVALPFLDRVDALLTDLESTLPVVHDIRPEVGRIDENVDHVTPRIGELHGQLDDFEGALDDVADPVVRVEAHMLRLLDAVEALEAVEALPEIQHDFGRVADDLDAMRGDFVHVRDLMEELVVTLQVLGDDFGDVVELLEETAESVDNLDRKTGPPPPGDVVPW